MGRHARTDRDMDVDVAEEITQDDAWAVISAYFDEHSLVHQQIHSFDEFAGATLPSIVHELGRLSLERREAYTRANQEGNVSGGTLWPAGRPPG